jgi:hypothetical protein
MFDNRIAYFLSDVKGRRGYPLKADAKKTAITKCGCGFFAKVRMTGEEGWREDAGVHRIVFVRHLF